MCCQYEHCVGFGEQKKKKSLNKKPKQTKKKPSRQIKQKKPKKRNETKNQTSGLETVHMLKVGEHQGTNARLPQRSIQSNTV